jgi:Cd(II)/Pb(II)-responsive transcriptional regulator
MRIGELAQQTGCQVETIRYYEREGLLPAPARSRGNYRRYGAEHLERLRFVRHCRSLAMSLEEIRLLLQFRDAPEDKCSEVNSLLDEHIGHVADRIAELRGLERQLRELRSLCRSAQAAKDCGILKELGANEGSKPRRRKVGHGHGPLDPHRG